MRVFPINFFEYGINPKRPNAKGLADLLNADKDLEYADLYGADLKSFDLEGYDLYGADLRGADLREAIISEARWEGADLRGARLEWTMENEIVEDGGIVDED